jgi:hypothetical protein
MGYRPVWPALYGRSTADALGGAGRPHNQRQKGIAFGVLKSPPLFSAGIRQFAYSGCVRTDANFLR